MTDFSHTADADLVRKTLAGGHAAYKELVTRYQGHVDGMDYQKVADFLDVPVGTVKSLIHRARAKLKAALPPAVTEEVSPMVQVERVFNEHRPPADLAEEVLKRIAHWERFGSAEGFPDAQGEKARAILADPQWRRLVEMELALEPMSEPCRAIRRQIACLERCHEHYVGNVEDILGMIGKMTPGRILDCLQACEERNAEAAAYADALEAWLAGERPPAEDDGPESKVFDLLGPRTEEKARLVTHVAAKLRDNGYRVYADDEEDFEFVESRIQHLEICNFHWQENLRIVLKEIAAGKRLYAWHHPDGYNAHGDCPNRVGELANTLTAAAAWADGDLDKAGPWAETLGERTDEKRWLVACLCRHVIVQHKAFDSETLLPAPSL